MNFFRFFVLIPMWQYRYLLRKAKVLFTFWRAFPFADLLSFVGKGLLVRLSSLISVP